jgi:hypothetical protein
MSELLVLLTLVAAGEIVDERKLTRTRKKREREREGGERKQTLHALLRKCYLEALGPRDP